MKIANVEAFWLSCPIPSEKQHRSDYGLLTHFDMTLVVVTTDSGLQGFGEAKAAVGSSGSCASIVHCVENEIKPKIVGQNAANIHKIWEMVYNDTRDHYALSQGRKFPVLGRRGLLISALSGVDTALWDLKGKSLETSVVNLLGGACRDEMEAYASGGWAGADDIGEQLNGYVQKGFKGVKMRVGIMDKSLDDTIQRVKNAREALGPSIKLMTDAHGTFSVPEAKQFAKRTEECNLYWFEEPISPDNKKGTAEVRDVTYTPIAAGESEYTSFDIRDLIMENAVDVLQPDCAIIGGITEAQRVSQLANVFQLELAPHCWGSAFSFMAGLSVAFASPSARVIEFSSGGNPMMYDLINEEIKVQHGMISTPDQPGLGISPNWDFVNDFKQ
ncbi:mandelate racemase/muconate lactonizing enzyme family protein [Portibacter marinus]|uniref:mandelate racemase/muconate lactonizing enzyme family protein n=1 Tax=Portibacter marinus TaxID=2898660 RepID=UPI001F321343|nr:mandelate racemase/muconate lactonizing enzyme family protein [Portibacter marinus]